MSKTFSFSRVEDLFRVLTNLMREEMETSGRLEVEISSCFGRLKRKGLVCLSIQGRVISIFSFDITLNCCLTMMDQAVVNYFFTDEKDNISWFYTEKERMIWFTTFDFIISTLKLFTIQRFDTLKLAQLSLSKSDLGYIFFVLSGCNNARLYV